MDVGITSEGTVWFRAASALQFARGFANEEHARKLLSQTLAEGDGVPDEFQRGCWKVGAARREAGLGSWSFPFSTLRDVVRTHVLLARTAPATKAWAHVTIPNEVQVQDFLRRC
jgi:hypothetical protein